jgi:hypothetical protein
MFSRNTVVAREARQNNQLSNHRIASRPLRKRCPLPARSLPLATALARL